MIVLSIGLLATVMALSMVGLYSAAYRDNWGQHVGLVLIVLWSAAEAVVVLQEHAVALRDMALYIALAAFACGTARKVRHHHQARNDARAGRQPNERASHNQDAMT